MARDLLSIALVLACLCLGCEEPIPLLLDATLEGDSPTPACSALGLRVRVGASTRYALSLDGSTVSTGALLAGESVIGVELPQAAGEPPGQASLELTVIGTGGSVERRSFPIERTANAAPHASAGPTRRLRVGEAISLDGSASRDPDGQALAHSWAVLQGPAILEDADTARPAVTLESPATAVVELTVTDPAGARGTDRVLLRALDADGPPLLGGGPLQVLEVEPGRTAEITVDASGPGVLAYRFTQTAGAQAAVSANGNRARIKAPSAPGLVAIEAAADNGFDEVRQRILLLVGDTAASDTPATPRATAPSDAPVLSTVVLDARESGDDETSLLGYLWTVEEAPQGSVLGPSHIEGNGTAAASQARVVLDRVGSYRFRLRAIDAVGASPTATEVTVRSTISSSSIDLGSPAQDVALADDGVVLAAQSGGAVLVRRNGGTASIERESVGAVVYSQPGQRFYYAIDGEVGPARLVRLTSSGVVDGDQSLPEDEGESPPRQVHEMGIDLSPDNLGDLFVATDSGFVIMLTDGGGKGDIGTPLFVQGGAVHKPPTFFDLGDPSLSDLSVRPPDNLGATSVFAGNAFWLIELSLSPDRSFSTRALDPLGDGEPDAVGHIAAAAEHALVWLETSGLVWAQGVDGRDCQLLPGEGMSCHAPAQDPCARALSAAPPADVLDLEAAPDGRLWIASSDGVRVFDPTNGTFLLLGAAEGLDQATALDVRGGNLAVAAGSAIVWLDRD